MVTYFLQLIDFLVLHVTNPTFPFLRFLLQTFGAMWSYIFQYRILIFSCPVLGSDVKSSTLSCPRGQNFVLGLGLGLEDLPLTSDSASSIYPRTVLERFMLASCTPLFLSKLSSFMVVFNYLLVYEV